MYHKRKLEFTKSCFVNNTKMEIENNCKIYNYYENALNCDKIKYYDNHIYFNSVITNDTINVLTTFIDNIIKSYNDILKDYEKIIYLHINTKGGNLYSILNFIEYKKKINFEIISIIEKECNDVGILLASLCNYRIINKKGICKLTKYNLDCTNLYYWGYFKQCENSNENIVDFYNSLSYIFCGLIESKFNYEKFKNTLENNNVWDSKKYKKLGLADEII